MASPPTDGRFLLRLPTIGRRRLHRLPTGTDPATAASPLTAGHFLLRVPIASRRRLSCLTTASLDTFGGRRSGASPPTTSRLLLRHPTAACPIRRQPPPPHRQPLDPAASTPDRQRRSNSKFDTDAHITDEFEDVTLHRDEERAALSQSTPFPTALDVDTGTILLLLMRTVPLGIEISSTSTEPSPRNSLGGLCERSQVRLKPSW
uniref:Uncharacterized protein n=1 Tax=Oryza nivara TaxID=4536 RepID=A0A0E0IDZ2_ORYNI